MPKPGGLWGSALHIYMQTLFFMDVAALCGGSWACAVRGGAVPGSLGGDRNRSEGVCWICFVQRTYNVDPKGKISRPHFFLVKQILSEKMVHEVIS